MGKKEKKVCALVDEFQAMINLVPKLKDLLRLHKEITEGYQKYRKNGGAAIPGLEKHLGSKEPKKAAPVKAEKAVSLKAAKSPKVVMELKKIKTKKIVGKDNSAGPDAGTAM